MSINNENYINFDEVKNVINSLKNIPFQSLELINRHNLLKNLAKAELLEVIIKQQRIHAEKEIDLLNDFQNKNNLQAETDFS